MLLVLDYPLEKEQNEEKLGELLEKVHADGHNIMQIPFPIAQAFCSMHQVALNLVLVPMQMPMAQEAPVQDSIITPPKSGLILPPR